MTLNKAYVIYTKNNSMNSRPDDRRILTLVNTTTKKVAKNVNDNEISQLARNRTLLQEIDQELPGHRILVHRRLTSWFFL